MNELQNSFINCTNLQTNILSKLNDYLKKKENLFQFSLKAALADDSKERSSAGYLGHFNNFLKRGLCNTYLTIG